MYHFFKCSINTSFQSTSSEGEETPLTWSKNYINKLKNIVNLHCSEYQSDDETEGASFRNIEDINVEVFIIFLHLTKSTTYFD